MGAANGKASPASLQQVIDPLLEILAEEEHVLWAEFMYSNGWKPASQKPAPGPDEQHARDNRLHHCLVPFSKLDDDTKNYDRDQICQYLRYADAAGFSIVSSLPR